MSPDRKQTTVSGILPMELANSVSDSLNHAMRRGLDPDAAVCVVLSMCVDYWRAIYGTENARKVLPQVILKNCDRPIRGQDISETSHGR